MEGIVSFAMCMGFLGGFLLMAFFFAFLDKISQRNFKSYYLECNDDKRRELDKALNDMIVCSNDFVEFTNTNYFKKMYNSLVGLHNFLKRRSLN